MDEDFVFDFDDENVDDSETEEETTGTSKKQSVSDPFSSNGNDEETTEPLPSPATSYLDDHDLLTGNDDPYDAYNIRTKNPDKDDPFGSNAVLSPKNSNDTTIKQTAGDGSNNNESHVSIIEEGSSLLLKNNKPATVKNGYKIQYKANKTRYRRRANAGLVDKSNSSSDKKSSSSKYGNQFIFKVYDDAGSGSDNDDDDGEESDLSFVVSDDHESLMSEEEYLSWEEQSSASLSSSYVLSSSNEEEYNSSHSSGSTEKRRKKDRIKKQRQQKRKRVRRLDYSSSSSSSNDDGDEQSDYDTEYRLNDMYSNNKKRKRLVD